MPGELRSVLIGTAGLGAAAAVALWLTLARGAAHEPGTAVRSAAGALALQAAHFAEEWATGFPRRFPELLGLAPWPPAFFPAFNLVWLAVWGLAVAALARRRGGALFPLWFLGVACVANGVAHPSLSLRVGGYFPGLATSPLVGVAGVLLLRRLLRATAGRTRAA